MTEDPFSTPASAPGINKIPFLVFDAILVITALALAFSAKGPLSPLVFFWILLCVAAGGLISCLPFWNEFRDRVRLRQYEIREQQSNTQDSQWQYVEARLTEQAEALQKLSLRMAEAAERLSVLEARPQAPDTEAIAALCASSAEKQSLTLRGELLAAVAQQTDAALDSRHEQSSKDFTAQESAIAQLRKDNLAAEAALRRLEAKIEEIALLATTAATTQSRLLTTTAAETGSTSTETEAKNTETEAKDTEAKDTTGAETELTAAETESPSAETESSAAGGPEVKDTPPSVAAPTETDTAIDAAPADDTSASQAIATDADTSATVADTDPVATATPDDASVVSAPEEAPAAPELIAEPVVNKTPVSEQPALLETPEPPARTKPSANKDKTTLVAQVLIGIGNKPYVRGTGPGLSLEKGVPMQFVEIGKWEWVSPNSHDPVSIQIYKNDEIPSTIGEIIIEPGQRRAVTPTFPK